MREIKFRAWDKKTRFMRFIDCLLPKKLRKGQSIHTVGLMNNTPIDIIMQYTGLKDNTKFKDLTREEQIKFMRENKYPTAQEAEKHWVGKEIYEGDIVKCWFKKHKDIPFGYDYHFNLLVVEYNKEETRFEPSYYLNKNRWTMHKADILCTKKVQVEVIGNIYENPELLKGEKQ